MSSRKDEKLDEENGVLEEKPVEDGEQEEREDEDRNLLSVSEEETFEGGTESQVHKMFTKMVFE